MQDNYIQPASHDLHDIHNDPEPIPTAGGEPIVMPIIEPVTSSRRRVRRKEKEKRKQVTRQALNTQRWLKSKLIK